MSAPFSEPPDQLGCVVPDLQVAISEWAAKGVGPFLTMRGVTLGAYRYQGRSSKPKIDAAFSQQGDLQIELIQPVNAEPSAYRDFLAAGGNGAHHHGWFCEDYAAAIAAAARAERVELQRGRWGAVHFVYYQPRDGEEMIGELIVERIRAGLPEGDATLVSLLAYAGLRPESEAVSLKWGQVGQRTLRIYASKTGRERHVRLLAPLAEDLAAWRTACGSPSEGTLVCPRDGGPWDQDAWRNWLRRVYRPAAINAGLEKTTRPRDLRGSFASLLVWEGQTVVEVAQQLGHSPEMCLRAYAGVFAEFSIEERVSAEQAIRAARAKVRQR
jgi:integrase